MKGKQVNIMASPTSIFSGLREAQTSTRGTYLTEGDYRLKIKKCQIIHPRNKGPAFVVDFEVVQSSNQQIPVGSERNWYQDMLTDSAKGSVKSFLLAVLKADEKNPEHATVIDRIEEVAEAAVSDANYLAGQEVACRVTLTKTKKGTDFHRHDWRAAL